MPAGNGRLDTVFVDVIVLSELDASILVEDQETGTRAIIPLSQLRDGTDARSEDDGGAIAIPRWLADDRGVACREAL